MSDMTNDMTALITGATGFIGQRLISELERKNVGIIALMRNPSKAHEFWPQGGVSARYGDFDIPETLKNSCVGAQIVFHLAGYAHAVDSRDAETENHHRRITVDGTRHLLAEAVKAGVKRFVYISSVKAMGEGGMSCLDETSGFAPVTNYGKARYQAEQFVLETAAKFGMEGVILRLPMVYGPGIKGNLPRLIQAIDHGRFPPLPETGNKRSMVDVRDVVQAAILAATNPSATGKIYIVTDGQAYTTRQIYEWICAVLGRPVPRWVIPLVLLRFAAYIGDTIGRLSRRRFILDTDALDKLLGSAWYSSEKISRELGYKPAYTLKDSLPEMVTEYAKNPPLQ